MVRVKLDANGRWLHDKFRCLDLEDLTQSKRPRVQSPKAPQIDDSNQDEHETEPFLQSDPPLNNKRIRKRPYAKSRRRKRIKKERAHAVIEIEIEEHKTASLWLYRDEDTLRAAERFCILHRINLVHAPNLNASIRRHLDSLVLQVDVGEASGPLECRVHRVGFSVLFNLKFVG